MIRFLRRMKYVYAMCAKPVVYARLIKSFWRTAEVVTDEAGVSVVRGNITRQLQLTVSEESIRTALRIDDEEIDLLDLVDEVPDNLLDDDEFRARYPEDDDENESDNGDDDSSNDGDDENDGSVEEESAESVPEEAEIVGVDKPL
ncbi:hypothetical protein QVD17_38193 [Tagetes erecta]|uniref:Uncharacterized protein n=1 Tax=Tagetes erecta TaxID=13708 RepID=A0AAD8JY71_TARER|nr:hypothetical protein QVD17_38193 [Tagetes erecta]